jgi:hypothetical protein
LAKADFFLKIAARATVQKKELARSATAIITGFTGVSEEKHMTNGDAIINRMQAEQAAATAPSALPPPAPKEPGKFKRIFGAILGGAVSMALPGAGSVIGSFINRGNLDYSNMHSMLYEQQMQSLQMLAIQNRVQTQTQEFTTVSNLLKARFDGEMSAVHNFKS